MARFSVGAARRFATFVSPLHNPKKVSSSLLLVLSSPGRSKDRLFSQRGFRQSVESNAVGERFSSQALGMLKLQRGSIPRTYAVVQLGGSTHIFVQAMDSSLEESQSKVCVYFDFKRVRKRSW